MKKTLIAVEARIPNPETAGGIGQVIMSMAKNLSQLDDGPEEYVFIGLENATDWLGKYIGVSTSRRRRSRLKITNSSFSYRAGD